MREEKKMKQKEKEKNAEKLLALLDKVNVIYCIPRHVSRSGMYRVISLCVVIDGEIWTIDHWAAPLLEGYDKRHNGLKAHGCGMDAGFHLVYNLSCRLYNNGYRLKHKWI